MPLNNSPVGETWEVDGEVGLEAGATHEASAVVQVRAPELVERSRWP